MKTEYWILLGVAGYFLLSKTGLPGSSGLPSGVTFQPTSGRSNSGATPSGGGGGGSSNLNPAAATASAGRTGQPTLATDGYYYCADGTQVNDPSLCPVEGSDYITCADGTMVNDPSLCTSGFQCWDGSVVSDPSQCPDPTAANSDYTGYGSSGYVDTGDPCDPNSSAYDPSQCGSGL